MKKHHLFFVIFLCVNSFVSSQVRKARSSNQLALMLARSPYSIVLFSDDSREVKKDKKMKEEVALFDQMFASMSNEFYYKESGLQFIRVDISREAMQSVVSQYSLSAIPTLLIFIGRMPTKERLQGFIYRTQLQDYIQRNLQTQMAYTLKEKEVQRNRALEQAKINAYNQAAWWAPYAPYWYGFYPYWSWYGSPYYW